MRETRLKGVVMLLLAALIWGTAFVAQSVGMQSMQPFTFSMLRMILGTMTLLPLILLRDRGRPAEQRRAESRAALRAGARLGLVLFVAANLQQFAFQDAGPGKIAFLTALYMFFVPLLALLGGRRIPAVTWLCEALGFLGLFLLCIGPEGLGGVGRGEVLAIGGALGFAVHILLIDRFASLDGVKLSCAQFAVAGLLSGLCAFLFEKPLQADLAAAAAPVLYAGVLSCGAAYTLQILGQKHVPPAVSSLLLCMESVFAVLAEALLLGTRMAPRELLGCAVMFGAILLSELTNLLRSRKELDS